MTETPDIAAPGKMLSASAQKRVNKGKRVCPVCTTNALEKDEDRCEECTQKAMTSREGINVGRDWIILIAAFTALMFAGQWGARLF